MKKILLTFLVSFLFVNTTYAQIFRPVQGGTGLNSATSGDINKCLKVSNNSPFTYTLGTCNPTIFGQDWNLTTNVYGQSSLAPTTTQNIVISGTGTSTMAGNLEVAGNLKISGALFTPISIYSSGTVTAGNFVANNASATSTLAGGLAIETSGLVYDYSTNNVGIGTASPTQKLDVGGNIRINGTGNWIGDSSANAFLPYANASADAQINSARHIILNSTSNVGIGTASPASKLQVSGTVSLTNGSDKYGFGSDPANYYIGGSIDATSGIPLHSYYGWTMRGGSGVGLRVDGSSNVGIGTVSPLSQLQIKGATNKEVQIGTTAGSFTSSTYFTDLTSLTNVINLSRSSDGLFTESIFNYEGGGVSNLGITARGDIKFVTGAIANQGLIIKDGGNVGIGTTSPTQKLSIAGSTLISNTSDTATALLVSGTAKGVRIGTTASLGIVEAVDNTGNASYQPLYINGSNIQFANSGTEAMRITGGNVGIGTTGPGYKLDVQGGNVNIGAAGGSGYLSTHGRYTSGNGNILFNDGTGTNLVLAETASNVYTFGSAAAGGIPSSVLSLNTSNGNVGIGTTSPQKTLHLYSSGDTALVIDGGSTVNPYISFRQNNVEAAYFQYTNTGSYMRYNASNHYFSGGGIGIGDSSPDAKLEILQASDVETQGLQITRSNDSNYTRMYKKSALGSLNDPLVFSSDFVTDHFAVGRDGSGYFAGNVGIGTASPSAPLHVVGTGKLTTSLQTPYIDFATGGSSGVTNVSFTSAGSKYGTIQTENTGGSGAWSLGYQNSAGATIGTKVLTWTGNGRVGIGTDAPSGELHISSSAPFFKLEATTGTNYVQQDFTNDSGSLRIGLENSGGGGLFTGSSAYAGLFGHTGAFPLQFFTSGTARMTVLSGGNVGIGTTSPSALLSIEGNNTWLLNIATSTGKSVMKIDNAGHLITAGPDPAISSCGSTPSVVGNDRAGTITVGSGVVTACTMTFAKAYTATPACVMTINTSAITGGITSISTTAVTFSFSATLGGGIIYYSCSENE